MKKLFYITGFIFFIGISVTAQSVGSGGGTIGMLEQWVRSGTTLSPRTATDSIKIQSLGSPGNPCLKVSSTGVVATTTCGSGSGTVTSVDMSVPTGLSVSGNPVTTSGTLALALALGYSIPKSASTTDWQNFFTLPSTQITAGTNLSWAGNTLNASGGSVAQLGQVGDVSTTSLAYGDVLRYNTATSKWESVATSSLGYLTTNVAEGSNLYYTDARARASVSGTYPIVYNSGTGAFSTPLASTTLAQTYGTDQSGKLTIATTTTDANIGLNISNVNGLFTFYPYFIGTLADNRIASASTWNAKVPGTRTLTIAGTANQITSSAGAQDLSTDRTVTLSIPNYFSIADIKATNSTTTNATTTGTIAIPVGASVVTPVAGNAAIDTTTGQFRYSDVTGTVRTLTETRYLGLSSATTTTWSGTTTGQYINTVVMPFAGTIQSAQCTTDAGTLNVDIYHTSTHLALLNASTTVNTITFTSNNTVTAGEKLYMAAGTPASTPTLVSCTLAVKPTPD